MISNEQTEKVMDVRTRQLIENARELGYLYIEAARQDVIFQFKRAQKEIGAPAVVLATHPRHTEIAVLLTNCALKEQMKIYIAAKFILSSSPCSLVLVNDKRMVCTRMNFGEGYSLAQWLCQQLNNPANLKIGEFSERNHDRVECRLRADSSLWVIAGAHHLGREANRRKAA